MPEDKPTSPAPAAATAEAESSPADAGVPAQQAAAEAPQQPQAAGADAEATSDEAAAELTSQSEAETLVARMQDNAPLVARLVDLKGIGPEAMPDFLQRDEDELLSYLADAVELNGDKTLANETKEFLLQRQGVDLKALKSASDEISQEVGDLLEAVSVRDLSIIAEAKLAKDPPIFKRLEELAQAAAEAEKAAKAAKNRLEGAGGEGITLNEASEERLIAMEGELEGNPQLKRAFAVILKTAEGMQEGSSMARFLQALFGEPTDFSKGPGGKPLENVELGESLLGKDDFKSELAHPKEFAKKFKAACEVDDRIMGQRLDFEPEHLQLLQEVEDTGDVKKLEKFLNIFVTQLFSSGSQEEVEKTWEAVGKNLGEKLRPGYVLARENLIWFYNIYQNKDNWKAALPSS